MLDNNCHQEPTSFHSITEHWLKTGSYFFFPRLQIIGMVLTMFGCHGELLRVQGFAVLCLVCPARLQLVLLPHQLWAILPECATARPSCALCPERPVHHHNCVLPLVLPPSWSAPLPSPLQILQTSQLPQTAQWLSGWAPDFPPHSRTHEISVLAWLPLEAVLLHSQTSCLVNKDYICIKGVENAIFAFSTMK